MTRLGRYVGVLWFVSLILHLLLIRFVSLCLCCISIFMTKLQQKLKFHDLVMVIESPCLLSPSLKVQVLPIAFITECGIVIEV